MKVARICACGDIVKGKCDKCSGRRRENEDHFRGSPAERGYDSQWRKLSVQFRIHNPLCQRCKQSGRATIADDVHHIKPIKSHPSLRLVWDNLMSLCRECHKIVEEETDA